MHFRKPFGRPGDPGVFPRHQANLVRGHLRRAAIGERRHAPTLLARRRVELRRLHQSRATRSANTNPSSNEFEASRFAPCTPVRDTSPHA